MATVLKSFHFWHIFVILHQHVEKKQMESENVF